MSGFPEPAGTDFAPLGPVQVWYVSIGHFGCFTFLATQNVAAEFYALAYPIWNIEMNRPVGQKTMEKRQPPSPEDDAHGATVSPEKASRNGESRSRRGRESNSEATPKQIRWVGRVLALLVILCLVLAAWVWTGILHGLP